MWAAVCSGRPDLKPLRVRAQPSGSRLQRSVSSVAVEAAAGHGSGSLEQLLRVHDFPAAEVNPGGLPESCGRRVLREVLAPCALFRVWVLPP